MTLCAYILTPQRNLDPADYCTEETADGSDLCPMHREEDPDAARDRDIEGWTTD